MPCLNQGGGMETWSRCLPARINMGHWVSFFLHKWVVSWCLPTTWVGGGSAMLWSWGSKFDMARNRTIDTRPGSQDSLNWNDYMIHCQNLLRNRCFSASQRLSPPCHVSVMLLHISWNLLVIGTTGLKQVALKTWHTSVHHKRSSERKKKQVSMPSVCTKK